ncbi:MAG: hypothetical protein WC849_01795 [Candidatus Paceibacterota bacterium]
MDSKRNKKIVNFIGQFRTYSLLDLAVLLVAIKTPMLIFIGAILLHLGFIAFLENQHKHSYREQMPAWVWMVLTILGVVFYRNAWMFGFILFGYLYTNKNKKNIGLFAPLIRGLQCMFLIAGITGFGSVFPLFVLVLMFVRNFLGDVRDVKKDKQENQKTLPILMKFNTNKNYKYIHLFGVIGTTIVWWLFSSTPAIFLFAVILLETLTYDLTSR